MFSLFLFKSKVYLNVNGREVRRWLIVVSCSGALIYEQRGETEWQVSQ